MCLKFSYFNLTTLTVLVYVGVILMWLVVFLERTSCAQEHQVLSQTDASVY